MSHIVRFAEEAGADSLGLYDFLPDQEPHELSVAERALERIIESIELLERFPFTCRKLTKHYPYLRELVISFGAAGYVAPTCAKWWLSARSTGAGAAPGSKKEPLPEWITPYPMAAPSFNYRRPKIASTSLMS